MFTHNKPTLTKKNKMPKLQNYQALRAKARRLAREIEELERAVKCPSNFAMQDEMPHATHVGWDTKTALFYTPSWVKDALLARQQDGIEKLARLVVRRQRALTKARTLFLGLSWSEKAVLTIVGANPDPG